MPVFLDLPSASIDNITFSIAGWVAGHAEDCPIDVHVNGRKVHHQLYERPDVTSALPGFPFVKGVAATGDLRALGISQAVQIELRYGDDREVKLCALDRSLEEVVARESELSALARRFCEGRLCCPNCHNTDFDRTSTERLACLRCGTTFSQTSQAFNFISDELRIESAISPTENISSNPYPPHALQVISDAVSGGGWVLDCGAGSRPARTPNVINLEIADYPSTDVLAVGEGLPFQDNTFDAILSLAVLEHVRDPFRCAHELIRVLKPGGRVLADVPFLQPVHGYPHHYYNMTQQGLMALFEGLIDIELCQTPLHGHPMFGISWTLREYLEGLPDGLRDSFQNLTVRDLVNLDVHSFLTDARATELSTAARGVVSCLNTLQGTKR
jgi:SAM-dependent methyltransferase